MTLYDVMIMISTILSLLQSECLQLIETDQIVSIEKININSEVATRFKGETAFFVACERGHTQVVQLLLGHSQLVFNWTPLESASRLTPGDKTIAFNFNG